MWRFRFNTPPFPSSPAVSEGKGISDGLGKYVEDEEEQVLCLNERECEPLRVFGGVSSGVSACQLGCVYQH